MSKQLSLFDYYLYRRPQSHRSGPSGPSGPISDHDVPQAQQSHSHQFIEEQVIIVLVQVIN